MARKRQKTVQTENQIISYIREFRLDRGFGPSLREIMIATGLGSPSNVKYHVDRLVKEGRLNMDPKLARSLSVPGNEGFIKVPLMGSIAAGVDFFLPDSQSAEFVDEADMIEIPESMIGRVQHPIALEVKGESMVDALIADGDIVILDYTSEAKRGDMVAAHIKSRDEFTLKHFYPEGESVRLQPANLYMEPIIEPAYDVQVVGKAVSVLRQY